MLTKGVMMKKLPNQKTSSEDMWKDGSIDENKDVDVDDEDKFYREMDVKKIHQSCCTCQTLTILFILLFFFLAGTFSYVLWQVKSKPIGDFSLKSLPSSMATVLKGFQGKLDELKSEKSKEVQITITEQEFTAMVAEGFSFDQFVLRDSLVKIDEANVTLYSNLVKPLNSRIIIKTIPTVKEGKLSFEITSIKTGMLELPKFLVIKISNNLSGLISGKINSVYNRMEIEKIDLKNGRMILTGKGK